VPAGSYLSIVTEPGVEKKRGHTAVRTVVKNTNRLDGRLVWPLFNYVYTALNSHWYCFHDFRLQSHVIKQTTVQSMLSERYCTYIWSGMAPIYSNSAVFSTDCDQRVNHCAMSPAKPLYTVSPEMTLIISNQVLGACTRTSRNIMSAHLCAINDPSPSVGCMCIRCGPCRGIDYLRQTTAPGKRLNNQ